MVSGAAEPRGFRMKVATGLEAPFQRAESA